MRAAPLAERFERHYIPEPNSGCWLWTATGDRDGYGFIAADRSRKMLGAHRVSYELHHGTIPDGMLVCHKCDVPGCVNPDHLFLGTNKDNSDDRDRKGRNVAYAGVDHGEAKLTDAAVRDIMTKRLPMREFAKLYDVSVGSVSKVWTGRNWNHITGLPKRI